MSMEGVTLLTSIGDLVAALESPISENIIDGLYTLAALSPSGAELRLEFLGSDKLDLLSGLFSKLAALDLPEGDPGCQPLLQASRALFSPLLTPLDAHRPALVRLGRELLRGHSAFLLSLLMGKKVVVVTLCLELLEAMASRAPLLSLELVRALSISGPVFWGLASSKDLARGSKRSLLRAKDRVRMKWTGEMAITYAHGVKVRRQLCMFLQALLRVATPGSAVAVAIAREVSRATKLFTMLLEALAMDAAQPGIAGFLAALRDCVFIPGVPRSLKTAFFPEHLVVARLVSIAEGALTNLDQLTSRGPGAGGAIKRRRSEISSSSDSSSESSDSSMEPKTGGGGGGGGGGGDDSAAAAGRQAVLAEIRSTVDASCSLIAVLFTSKERGLAQEPAPTVWSLEAAVAGTVGRNDYLFGGSVTSLQAHKFHFFRSLVVGTLSACPDLYVRYVSNFRSSMEPRLSPAWVASATLVIKLLGMRLPRRMFPSGAPADPAGVVAYLMPHYLVSREGLRGGLAVDAPPLVCLLTLGIIERQLTRIADFLDALNAQHPVVVVEEGDEDPFARLRRDVEAAARSKLPQVTAIRDTLSRSRAAGERGDLISEAALRALDAYHRAFPARVHESTVDLLTMLRAPAGAAAAGDSGVVFLMEHPSALLPVLRTALRAMRAGSSKVSLEQWVGSQATPAESCPLASLIRLGLQALGLVEGAGALVAEVVVEVLRACEAGASSEAPAPHATFFRVALGTRCVDRVWDGPGVAAVVPNIAKAVCRGGGSLLECAVAAVRGLPASAPAAGVVVDAVTAALRSSGAEARKYLAESLRKLLVSSEDRALFAAALLLGDSPVGGQLASRGALSAANLATGLDLFVRTRDLYSLRASVAARAGPEAFFEALAKRVDRDDPGVLALALTAWLRTASQAPTEPVAATLLAGVAPLVPRLALADALVLAGLCPAWASRRDLRRPLRDAVQRMPSSSAATAGPLIAHAVLVATHQGGDPAGVIALVDLLKLASPAEAAGLLEVSAALDVAAAAQPFQAEVLFTLLSAVGPSTCSSFRSPARAVARLWERFEASKFSDAEFGSALLSAMVWADPQTASRIASTLGSMASAGKRLPVAAAEVLAESLALPQLADGDLVAAVGGIYAAGASMAPLAVRVLERLAATPRAGLAAFTAPAGYARAMARAGEEAAARAVARLNLCSWEEVDDAARARWAGGASAAAKERGGDEWEAELVAQARRDPQGALEALLASDPALLRRLVLAQQRDQSLPPQDPEERVRDLRGLCVLRAVAQGRPAAVSGNDEVYLSLLAGYGATVCPCDRAILGILALLDAGGHRRVAAGGFLYGRWVGALCFEPQTGRMQAGASLPAAPPALKALIADELLGGARAHEATLGAFPVTATTEVPAASSRELMKAWRRGPDPEGSRGALDPAFLMPVLHVHLSRSGGDVDLQVLHERGLIGFCICSLSSSCEAVRQMASECLGFVLELMAPEVKEVHLKQRFTLLRGVLASVRESVPAAAVAGAGAGAVEGGAPHPERPPPLAVTWFLARACALVLRPDDPMFEPTFRLISHPAKQGLSVAQIPLFHKFLLTAHGGRKATELAPRDGQPSIAAPWLRAARMGAVRAARAGLMDPAGLRPYDVGRVLRHLMVLASGPSADLALRRTAFAALTRAARVSRAALVFRLFVSSSVLGWVQGYMDLFRADPGALALGAEFARVLLASAVEDAQTMPWGFFEDAALVLAKACTVLAAGLPAACADTAPSRASWGPAASALLGLVAEASRVCAPAGGGTLACLVGLENLLEASRRAPLAALACPDADGIVLGAILAALGAARAGPSPAMTLHVASHCASPGRAPAVAAWLAEAATHPATRAFLASDSGRPAYTAALAALALLGPRSPLALALVRALADVKAQAGGAKARQAVIAAVTSSGASNWQELLDPANPAAWKTAAELVRVIK